MKDVAFLLHLDLVRFTVVVVQLQLYLVRWVEVCKYSVVVVDRVISRRLAAHFVYYIERGKYLAMNGDSSMMFVRFTAAKCAPGDSKDALPVLPGDAGDEDGDLATAALFPIATSLKEVAFFSVAFAECDPPVVPRPSDAPPGLLDRCDAGPVVVPPPPPPRPPAAGEDIPDGGPAPRRPRWFTGVILYTDMRSHC